MNLCLIVLAQGKYLFAYNLQSFHQPFSVLPPKNTFCKNVNLSEKSEKSCKLVNGLIWEKNHLEQAQINWLFNQNLTNFQFAKEKKNLQKKKSSYFKHIEVWCIFFSLDKYTWACCQGNVSPLLALEGKDQIIWYYVRKNKNTFCIWLKNETA